MFDTTRRAMAGNPLNVAREWAKAGLCDAQIAAKLKGNYRALILQSMEPGGLATVTSATKNGVQMGKSMGLSIQETLTAMGKALEWIEIGYVPQQSRSLGRF
jgi:hypothetical protein